MNFVEAEQFGFDFEAAERERPFTERHERLARIHREEWTEENLCLAWVVAATKVCSRHWRDWWASLPNYERTHLLNVYRAERDHAEFLGCGMRPYESIVPTPEAIDEMARKDREVIETIKVEILEAAKERRGIPRRESDDMRYIDRLTLRRQIETAMRELGVVLIEPAQPKEDE